MFRNIIQLILLFSLVLGVAGCDSNQEVHRKTLEEQLVDSFQFSNRDIKARVQEIVTASNEKNYTRAMNELAILSATNLNNPEQDRAIKLLMEQLRYNLEEDEISRSN